LLCPTLGTARATREDLRNYVFAYKKHHNTCSTPFRNRKSERVRIIKLWFEVPSATQTWRKSLVLLWRMSCELLMCIPNAMAIVLVPEHPKAQRTCSTASLVQHQSPQAVKPMACSTSSSYILPEAKPSLPSTTTIIGIILAWLQNCHGRRTATTTDLSRQETRHGRRTIPRQCSNS
jgi:hypothetical protein